jgi:sentrin-specific protease 1
VSNDDNINNDILNLEDEQPNLEELDQLAEIRREPLSNDDELKVDAELCGIITTTKHKIVTNKFNIDMTRNKIRCLIPYTWLNDEVINFYMRLLQQRDDKLVELEERKVSSHYFSSFFIVKMYKWSNDVQGEYTYSYIKRWTKNFNVFLKDKIFIPININNTHWTLIIVYIQLKIIRYYDSLMGRDIKNHMIHVLKWLKDESKEKYNNSYPVNDEEWQLIDQGEVDLPRQSNGYDCGVFIILYADFRSDNIPWGNSFQQSEILSYRKKICAAILRGTLLY